MKNPMKANRSKDKKRGTFIGSYEKNGVTKNVVVHAPQRTIRSSALFDSIFQGYRTPWVKSLKAAPPLGETAFRVYRRVFTSSLEEPSEGLQSAC